MKTFLEFLANRDADLYNENINSEDFIDLGFSEEDFFVQLEGLKNSPMVTMKYTPERQAFDYLIQMGKTGKGNKKDLNNNLRKVIANINSLDLKQKVLLSKVANKFKDYIDKDIDLSKFSDLYEKFKSQFYKNSNRKPNEQPPENYVGAWAGAR
jgi:hypothetical protein